MFEEHRICPYPGLRSFNEDESIYFKGREEHIEEVIDLLQNNKFLMVTGASGDGKSSLIFAGLVPNARAGFFKASYNNWTVSHFRPERNPVKNFAHSLSDVFNDLTEETIETELNRGFSSLVDLYKNSSHYFDNNTIEYQNATEDNKASIKRKCSNLLIVVDQFEEFFTNIENFHDGVPSQSSQTLINVLLETSRIALNDNLPIYVVFTMRSDYIGQCAAFRGLPEYIGFSQFFVPRLKRKDLQQVIEEPAKLNGDEISRRLVERLLYDMSDGVDQLPILQHALSQIWHQSSEEGSMDLLHYAQVGGMSMDELPEEDKVKFTEWFNVLPQWKQSHFSDPGLKRILDIHANELYQTAWNNYQDEYPDQPISIADAKRIIALAFACLTKIDDSRAVRNLMTLNEITRIINRDHLDQQVVDRVLRIFRDQGNTFIRPFVDEDNADTQNLTSEAVLDITHESLIRNWDRLNKWANKEFEYYETFMDFEKQMSKWLESNKDKGYLLPIGPLTYFETWYNECQPNVFWINRYLDLENGETKKSKEILRNTKEFLNRSAKKVTITRAFIKYGTAKIASILAVVLVIALSGFYYIDANKKQNSTILSIIQKDGLELLDNSQVNPFVKGIFLLAGERMRKGNMIDNLDQIDTLSMRLDAANSAYMVAFSLDNGFNPTAKNELVDYISRQLDSGGIENDLYLKQLNFYLFNRVNEAYNLNQPDKEETKIKLVINLLKSMYDQKVDDILEFNHGINHVMNLGNLTDVEEIVGLISPFNSDTRASFDNLYPANATLINGRVGGLSHNSGYQIAGSLYASLGNIDLVEQCLDSLLKYNSNYMEVDSYINGFDIVGYLLRYNHEDLVSEFFDYFSERTGIDKVSLITQLMDRTGFMKFAYSYYWWEIPSYNYGLSLLPPDKIAFLFDYFEDLVKIKKSGNEMYYQLAILYKQRGIYIHKYLKDRGLEVDNSIIHSWFDKALENYKRVDSGFLLGMKSIRYRYYTDGFRSMSKPRWYFFLYPDHLENGWYNDKFTSTSFASYLIEKDKMMELYHDGDQLEVFNDWLANYNERFNINNAPEARRNLPEISIELLDAVYTFVSTNNAYSNFDNTFLNLLLVNDYLDIGDDKKGMMHYNSLSITQLQPLATRWEYLNYTFIQNQVLSLAKSLARRDDFEGSKLLLETMSNNNDRSICYTEIAKDLFKYDKGSVSFVFLDSAISKGNKTDETIMPNAFSYRYYLVNALSGIGGRKMNEMAYRISNQVPVIGRDVAVNYYVQGIAFEGNYYRAYQAIPTVGSLNGRLFMLSSIYGEESERSGPREGWENFDKEWKHAFKEYVVFDDNYF